MKLDTEILNKILKLPIDTSCKKLEIQFNISKAESERYQFVLKNKDILIVNDLEYILNIDKYRAKLRREKNKVKELTKHIKILSDRNEFINEIKDKSEIGDIEITPSTLNEAVAISILSDVHIEERVDSETVDGFNEYNPSIAEKRLNKYFQNLLTVVNKERQDVRIDTLILGFLGDFISGYIHEELKEENYLSPIEATRLVKKVLLKGLKYLAENGNFKEIIIPCCKGNHGRTTTKKRHGSAYKNSYEWLMYHEINDTIKLMNLDNIKMIIPKSEFCYLKIYDKTLRFGHGDHFRYMGGIGGINVPLNRFLMRANQIKYADMTFLGHWHQAIKPYNNCVLNGSIIGMNNYSYALQFAKEEPLQQFQLLDKKHGFDTMNTVIRCN